MPGQGRAHCPGPTARECRFGECRRLPFEVGLWRLRCRTPSMSYAISRCNHSHAFRNSTRRSNSASSGISTSSIGSRDERLSSGTFRYSQRLRLHEPGAEMFIARNSCWRSRPTTRRDGSSLWEPPAGVIRRTREGSGISGSHEASVIGTPVIRACSIRRKNSRSL